MKMTTIIIDTIWRKIIVQVETENSFIKIINILCLNQIDTATMTFDIVCDLFFLFVNHKGMIIIIIITKEFFHNFFFP